MAKQMKYKLFRMYNGEKTDDNYAFSVVAGNNEVHYVVPKDSTEYALIFNDERIKDLVIGADPENIPTDPTGWALLASYNAGFNMNLFTVDNTDTDDFELLLEDEQEYADTNAKKYGYLRDKR